MNKCKQFLSLFFLLTFALTSMQAQRKLTGKVVDSETNEILIGASITIKKSNIGTITDFEGRYELELPDGNVSVEVSYVGYQTKVIEEVQSGELNMQLTAGQYDIGSFAEQTQTISVAILSRKLESKVNPGDIREKQGKQS